MATWSGRHRDGCLLVKVLGERFRIWMPKSFVVRVGRLHERAA